MTVASESCPMTIKAAQAHLSTNTYLEVCITATLSRTGWFTEGKKTKLAESFPVNILRKISRLALREDGAGPIFIPSACSGTCNVELKIYKD